MLDMDGWDTASEKQKVQVLVWFFVTLVGGGILFGGLAYLLR